MTVATSTKMDLGDIMKFELSAYPTALFETPEILWKADNSQLAHTIKNKCISLCKQNENSVQSTGQYVLDGRSILHHIVCRKYTTYKEIADMYTNFVIQNYGKAIVVFDGYNNTSPTIKDMTHMRWRKGIQSASIIIYYY